MDYTFLLIPMTELMTQVNILLKSIGGASPLNVTFILVLQ